MAVICQFHPGVDLLLQRTRLVNVINDDGSTALTHCRTCESLRLLLASGARPAFEQPEDGWTFLRHACSNGDMQSLSLLLAHLTDAERRAAINRMDEFGSLPLVCAIRENNLPVVKLLLENGAAPT